MTSKPTAPSDKQGNLDKPKAPKANSPTADAISEILTETLNNFYDYITEKDIIKAAEEYYSKTTFTQAKAKLQALIDTTVVERLTDLQGWIERTHLGKGFDGSDRWEHCAAEIIDHIKQLELSQREGTK